MDGYLKVNIIEGWFDSQMTELLVHFMVISHLGEWNSLNGK